MNDKKIFMKKRYKILTIRVVGNAAILSQPDTFEKKYLKFLY